MRHSLFVWAIAAFLLVGCSSTDSSLTGQATHGTYNAFSASEDGFRIGSGLIFASDTVVYKNAWYSVNGSAWQPLVLSGRRYGVSGSPWLSGSANVSLPTSLLGLGEHYVIVYSCTRVGDAWDCHDGRWQLLVFAPYLNVYLDKGSDCGDVLDYQCGTKTVCNDAVQYGDCPSGYDCADNLCIARDDLTCDGVTCDEDEYCSRGVCLLSVPGKTYFVAPWGDNSWSGNFTHPFRNWQKPVTVLLPGDIAYFRGGVWQPTSVEDVWQRTGDRSFGMLISGPTFYNTAKNGTAEAPIRYFNYPGEKPIMDGELILPTPGGWLYGISIEGSEHIHLRGLTVRHIHMIPPDFSGGHRNYSEVFGIGSTGANLRYENMVVHDIDGRGFQHWSRGWDDAWNGYNGGDALFDYDNTSWFNCDAYNLFDRYDNTPGNAADGWLVKGFYGTNAYLEDCRAWQYADDGFNTDGRGHFRLNGCWAMSTDKYAGLTGLWGIEGNGFKTSGVSNVTVPNYTLGGERFVKIENSIAANCVGAGVINNIVVYMNNGQWPNNGLLYNNLGYKSSGNFWDGGANYNGTRSTVFKNNIAYGSTALRSDGSVLYEVGIYRPSIYPHSHNTWIGTMKAQGEEGTWPGWKYNPAFNVTDEDFVSLDYWQLTRPRKADGSLPDIEFGHLAPGSDLIDGGTIIPGYHCVTAGDHPGEDCRVWYGAAPDLGPFEYQG